MAGIVIGLGQPCVLHQIGTAGLKSIAAAATTERPTPAIIAITAAAMGLWAVAVAFVMDVL